MESDLGLIELQPPENLSSNELDFEYEILATMQQYRNDPNLLIASLRQDIQIYQLEQVRQMAGAHEVDITASVKNGRVLRPVA